MNSRKFIVDVTSLQTCADAPKQTRSGLYRNQQTSTKDGRKQVTFKLPEHIVDQVREVAYWKRVEQWEFVAEWLQRGLDDYVKKHGAIKHIPTSNK